MNINPPTINFSNSPIIDPNNVSNVVTYDQLRKLDDYIITYYADAVSKLSRETYHKIEYETFYLKAKIDEYRDKINESQSFIFQRIVTSYNMIYYRFMIDSEIFF